MPAQPDVLLGTRDDVLAQSHSLLAVDVYQPFQTLDQAAITHTYLQAAAQDDDQLEAILAELHALKLSVMMQLYTTEQSLQSVHHSQLEIRLDCVEIKQRTAHWIKDALRGLVQHLKEAFSSFFAAGRASPLESAPARLPGSKDLASPDDKTAPSSSASSFLAGIVKPDTDLDFLTLSRVDAQGSTTDLDELESILADVNELFLQLTIEIYNAYANVSNLQGHKLAGVLTDINAHESEQERDRDAIVNFLELLRATLGGLQQPELALALG